MPPAQASAVPAAWQSGPGRRGSEGRDTRKRLSPPTDFNIPAPAGAHTPTTTFKAIALTAAASSRRATRCLSHYAACGTSAGPTRAVLGATDSLYCSKDREAKHAQTHYGRHWIRVELGTILMKFAFEISVQIQIQIQNILVTQVKPATSC